VIFGLKRNHLATLLVTLSGIYAQQKSALCTFCIVDKKSRQGLAKILTLAML
jgi:hypothetical protein